MTLSALPFKWIVSLALVLVCQTARLIEGHPQASSGLSDASVKNSSAQDTWISELIEMAYKNNELLRPEEWSQQTNRNDSDNNNNKDDTNDNTDHDDDDNSEDDHSEDDHSEEDNSEEDNSEEDTSKKQESSNDKIMQYRKRKLLQVLSTTTSMHRSSDEKIIFPDGRISLMSPQMLSPATACRKSTFCENVTDYPRQLVNAAIARNASLRFLESVDPMPDIEQRIDVTDESICRFREQVVYPQTAQNKEKQWLFIVNQNDLKQGIRIEVCLNDGQECNMIDGFAEGYKTICKQKFIYRELAAVGSDGNIVKDQFRFPSSCCCHIKFIGDPTVRLGLRLDLSTNRTQYNRSSSFSTQTMP